MTQGLRASRPMALLSGLVLGLGMPLIHTLGQSLGLPADFQRIAALFGLVFLFLLPVLVFVVGSRHLGIGRDQSLRGPYWASLGQVGIRALFWLCGTGAGYALYTALGTSG